MALAITLSLTALLTAQKQTDLVSSWSGSTARVFSGDNDGYLINGAKIGVGKISKGFLFDGIDDYVFVPPDPRLNVGAQGSIAFWMRADRQI